MGCKQQSGASDRPTVREELAGKSLSNSHPDVERDLAAGSFSGLLGLIGGYGARFVFVVVVARILGAELSGQFFSVFSLLMFATILARVGLDKVALRDGSSFDLFAQPLRAKHLTFLLLFIAFLGGVLFCMVWLVSEGSIAGVYVTGAARDGLTAIGFSIPFLSVGYVVSQLLRSRRRIMASSVVQPISLYTIAVAIVVVLHNSGRSSIESASVSVLVASILSLVAGFVMLNSELPIRELLDVARRNRIIPGMFDLFAQAPFFLLLTILTYTLSGVDVMVIGAIAPGEQIAFYVAASRTAMAGSLGLLAVNSIVGPLIARQFHDGNLRSLQDATQMGARWALTSCALVVGFMIFGGDRLLELFGEGFGSASPILYVLLGGQLVNSAVGSVSLVLQMTKNERWPSLVLAVTLALALPAYLVLVSGWGVLYGGVVTAAAVTLSNLALFRICKQEMGIDSHATNIGRVVGFLTLCAVVGLVARTSSRAMVDNLILATYVVVAPLICWKLVIFHADRMALQGLVGGLRCKHVN